MKLRSTMAAASLLLAGCGAAKGEFALPVEQAHRKLVASTLDEFKFDRQCGILIHITPQAGPSNSIIWTVTSSGQRMFDFTANLTPASDRSTAVAVDISNDPNGREAYDGSQEYFRPAVQQPTRAAIEEAIAAVLEDRPYDPKRIPDAPKDSVCLVQRAGLEGGHTRFSVNDEPGGQMNSAGRWDNPDESDSSRYGE
jgi:hypothetical protein